MLSTGCWCWPRSLYSEWSYSPTSTGGTRTTPACRSSQPSSPSPYIATSSQSVSGSHSYFGSPRWWRELSNWLKAETKQGQQHHHLLLQTIQFRMERRKFPRVEIIIFLNQVKMQFWKTDFLLSTCRQAATVNSAVQCQLLLFAKIFSKYLLNFRSVANGFGFLFQNLLP